MRSLRQAQGAKRPSTRAGTLSLSKGTPAPLCRFTRYWCVDRKVNAVALKPAHIVLFWLIMYTDKGVSYGGRSD
jgi:hypothetical protein